MQRGAWWLLAGSVITLAACSDSPTALKSAPTAASFLITPPGNLDQSTLAVLSLYPKGLETAATTRWSDIKSKYAAGLSDPAQMAVARSMLAELTDWLEKKTPDMATPPDGEARTSATARAVLYMSMYVFNGPETVPPTYSPNADAVTGLVTPDAPATIVTPTKHAGVQFEAGSVDETTIIVITQNLTPYPANCSGPLQTKLCQYPQFYTFEQFPHKTLLKPAKFNACHINAGANRRPLADHDRFRLAHSKPADPADYTPGSVIRDQTGESIEILPLVPQTFSTCEDNEYTQEIVASTPTSLVSRLARAVKKIVTPRTAYAIDLGLGGLSRTMSPFNDVDPQSAPDLAVNSVAVATVCGPVECLLRPGGRISVNYEIGNVGTATGAGTVPIRLVSALQNPEDPAPPAAFLLGTFDVSVVPGASSARNGVELTIPASIAPGNYLVSLSVTADADFPESSSTLANNLATAALSVTGSNPEVVRVCATNITTTPVTVPDLQTAMGLVAPGGTVRICDGTYSVSEIDLTPKSMTIEGEGPGTPILDAQNAHESFYMGSQSPVTTSVILRNLQFQNAAFASINVTNNYGSLLVDDVDFFPTHGVPPNPSDPVLAYSSGIFVGFATGNGVTIQNSTFTGGDIGVHETWAANLVIVNNTFTGQTNASIHADGGGLLAAANIVRNCGTHWCIGLWGSSQRGNHRLSGNVITVPSGTRTENAIQMYNTSVEISGNEITGLGGNRVPGDPATWPMGSAIFMDGASSVTVSSNSINGAHYGLAAFNGSSVTGTDNIFASIAQGLSLGGAGPVSITRSDFTGYTIAWGGTGFTGSLRCNWWGSTDGPTRIESFPVDAQQYTPWALEPIARHNTVTCPTP